MNRKKRASMSTDEKSFGAARRTAFALLLCLLLSAPGSAGWGQAPAKSAPQTDPAANPRLLEVKRVCVQKLGDDAIGALVQEMVIAKLFEARRFSLTENCEKADFILKGSVTERSDRASRSETESIGVRASAAASESERAGSASDRTSAAASAGLNAHEALSSSEMKQQAAVTLRLVDKDGEILWAISSESTGGKTKSAMGDAADRAVQRLLRDIQRAEKQARSRRTP